MKGSEKMSVYVASFIFVIVGYLLALIISDILVDIIVDLNIDFLTSPRAAALILAVFWFIITFLTGWGSTRWIEEGEKVGIISLFFFILWIITSLGVVIATIIDALINDSSVVINLDLILDELFFAFTIALAPTVSVLLSVSNKTR